MSLVALEFKKDGITKKLTVTDYGTGEKTESAFRSQYNVYEGMVHIPYYGYIHTQDDRGIEVGYNTDGIGEENQALWCDIKEHAFSARDDEKTVITRKGRRMLGCGPCINKTFPGENGNPSAITAEVE